MKTKALIPGEYYHIYNRGNNRENIFKEEKNYHYFMGLYDKYIVPIAETYAYCLLRNHFHFMVRIKDAPKDSQSLEDWLSYQLKTEDQTDKDWQSYISLQFRNFFSTYSKAINKAYQRTGSLFEKSFKRRLVSDDSYFKTLIVYIHQNPQKHGFVDDFRDWPFSSYQSLMSAKPTRLQRDGLFLWFGDESSFRNLHWPLITETDIANLAPEDIA